MIPYQIHAGAPFTIRYLHNTLPWHDHRFGVTKSANWQRLIMEADSDTLWNRFKASLRRNIRKAKRDAVSIEIVPAMAGLQAFYQTYLRIRKHKYQLRRADLEPLAFSS